MVKRITHIFFALSVLLAHSGVAPMVCVEKQSMCCAGCDAESTDNETVAAENCDAADAEPPCCEGCAIADLADGFDAVPVSSNGAEHLTKQILLAFTIHDFPAEQFKQRSITESNRRLNDALTLPLYLSLTTLLI
jgi:hypothetical protein